MEVQDNGFIQIDTVDVDLSRMYIDPEEKRVHIIALPLSVETKRSVTGNWERDLERTLISLIEISQIRNAQEATEITNVIRQNISSLDSLYRNLRKTASGMVTINCTEELIPEKSECKKEEDKRGKLHFITRSAVQKTDIIVDKNPFVLGKNPRLADGVLSMSPTISRRHCMISCKINLDNTAIGFSSPEAVKLLKDSRNLMIFENIGEQKLFDVPLAQAREYAKPLETGEGYYILGNQLTKVKTVLYR